MWCNIRMESISWTNRITNEKSIKKKTKSINRIKLIILRHKYLLRLIIEGSIEKVIEEDQDIIYT